MLATPVYRSTAEVYLQQTAPKVMIENQSAPAPSEGFLSAQADMMRSTPVLSRALNSIDFTNMRTFARVKGDPVDWLRAGNGFDVEAERKSDSLFVSMESPYSSEAADFVNAVVESFIQVESEHGMKNGAGMLELLRKELNGVGERRMEVQRDMQKLKEASGETDLREDQNNDVLRRMSTLSSELSIAQLEVIDLRAREQAAKDVMKDPASIAAFVQAQQAASRDPGDEEYRDLKSKLEQTKASLAVESESLDENHPRIQSLKVFLKTLEVQLAQKEQSIALANLADVSRQLQVSIQKESKIQTDMDACRSAAMNLNPALASWAEDQTEMARLDQQTSVLNDRISQITANSADSGNLNVQILDPAREQLRPVWPRKSLILAAALLAGILLGSGLSLVRERFEAKLTNPADVELQLATPVIAMVPQINPRLSPSVRGQLANLDARSPAAEAYRSIRTLLQLGAARGARTILIASPTRGDGKSTTASNLAITFAQNGCRTLLIDCDLREPVQHSIFGLDGTSGLSRVMVGDQELVHAIQPTGITNLQLLPCGPLPTNPSELLASARFSQMLLDLAKTYDRIVIDSPPICPVTDARILAATCDATLLVLRMNKSMRAYGIEAMSGLEMVGARVVGAVANGASSRPAGYGYGGRAWQYATPRRALLDPAFEEPENGEGHEIHDGNGTENGNKIADGNGNGNGRGHREESPHVGLDDPDDAAAALDSNAV